MANTSSEDDPYDDLVASIRYLLPTGEAAKRKRFSRNQRTPKPMTPDETAAMQRPDKETSPLVLAAAPRTSGLTGNQITLIIGILAAAATLLAAFITIIPPLLERQDNYNATQTSISQTQIVQAATERALQPPMSSATLTITPSPTIPTATETPSPTIPTATETPSITPTTGTPLSVEDAALTALALTVAARQTATASSAVQTATAQAPTDVAATQNAFNTAVAATTTAVFQGTLTVEAYIATLDAPNIALERAGVSSNQQWRDWYPTGFVNTFNDGIPMVLVPTGCFMIGSDDQSDEKPVHEQCLDAPFWIDQTEVTRAQYDACVGAGRCEALSTGANQYSDEPNQPVNYVTWAQARAYCAARGSDYRLPTEREWEYAARGVDSWVYPWGDAWDANNAVHSGNSGSQTAAVGSRPNGAAWVGAHDMAGNLWEWTSSLYQAYEYDAVDGRENPDINGNRVVRGGAFNYTSTYLRAAARLNRNTNFDNVGFRCVRS